uniref:protein disulfide-isomerase n=1 Tax=Ananas comosus var. bracteatus TaxID=296719 RepID=A0A6V7QFZ3_ANACO|nr:unnamed protein product [Ananas comosus var. bracteatus]
MAATGFDLLLRRRPLPRDGGWEEGEEAAVVEGSAVLTLDASNFSEVVAKHPFIVVEFYAPWSCVLCKKLDPEYEKAAAVLSEHDPPIILAKFDADNEKNRGLADQFGIDGFPTVKILRNQGKSAQEYKGPRKAEAIVQYLKKQAGPASAEIKTVEDAGNYIDDKTVTIVGVFPEYTGEEFENFRAVAEKLRSDYVFAHTLDAKLLPRGDSAVKGPAVRLFKPFDELFMDFEDFSTDALEKFIEVASVPTITIFNKDPSNHPFLMKFFNSPNSKALLFLRFNSYKFDVYKSKLHEVAELYKGKNISFLIGDSENSESAFEYFEVKDDQAPLIILLQEDDNKKYIKTNVEPDQIAAWLKDYQDGKLTPFRKSEPIPVVNDEPVKVVVADSLRDVVFNSGKNVFLEFYAPWCEHCKKLAPILEEVAISFKNETDIVIAKMDATANDVPKEFDIPGYPTLYFVSASGKRLPYDGERTAEEIIDFVQKNRETTSDTTTSSESIKDEL